MNKTTQDRARELQLIAILKGYVKPGVCATSVMHQLQADAVHQTYIDDNGKLQFKTMYFFDTQDTSSCPVEEVKG